jgi:hypothetical protein
MPANKDFAALYQPPVGADDTLRPLMQRLYEELQRESPCLPEVRAALLGVLAFLKSPCGKTDANCRAVDSFLSKDEAWDADRLPEPLIDVLSDMCGALHDSVSAPHVAENFESTPEQLFDRATRL